MSKQEVVESVEVKPEAPAPVAPKNIRVSGALGWRDVRADTVKALDAAHPEFVHSFQVENVPSATLELNGQEIVRNASGQPMKIGQDIVVRQKKEEFQALRKQMCDSSYEETKGLWEKKEANEGFKDVTIGQKVPRPVR